MNRIREDIKKPGTVWFRAYFWLVVPCVLIAVYVFPFEFNGLLDMPNHMARADIMRRCLLGSAEEICSSYVVKPIPVPPFFADLSLMAYLSIFRPFFAEKMAIYCLLCLFTTAWYLLYLRINNSINVGYTAGLSLVVSNYLYSGFYAYLFSVVLTIFWIYFWWPSRDHKTIYNQVMLGLFMIIIFGCHLAGFLFVAIIYTSYDIHKALKQNKKLCFLYWSFLKGTPVFVSFIGLSIWQLMAGRSFGRSTGTSIVFYKSLLNKVYTLLFPFINYAIYFDLLTFILLLVILFCSVDVTLFPNLFKNFWTRISIIFFILFALTPTGIGGLYDIDCRFLLIGYLALFISLGSVAKPWYLFRWAMTIVLLVSLSGALFYKNKTNAELNKVYATINLCDSGKSLVGINSIKNYPFNSKSRVNPFPHFSAYYIFNGGSFVTGLFEYIYFYPKRNPAFVGRNQFHSCKFHGITDLSTQNQKDINNIFDYVLVTSFESEPQIQNYLTANKFSLIAKKDYIYLFAVNRGK